MPTDRDVGRINSGMTDMKINAAKPAKASGGHHFGDKLQRQMSALPAARQPPTEDDSWTTVGGKHQPSVTFNSYPRPPKSSTWQPGTPSAAATSRNGVYGNRTKTSSGGYKQQFQPPEQQDPILLEAEKNKGSKFPKNFFRAGMVFRAVLHDQDFMATSSHSQVTVADKHRTESIYGPIYTKIRHMIVLALYEDHYIAIPLFTHNGNGLEKKIKKDEFVSVRDFRDMNPISPLSSHRPLQIVAVNPGVEPFDPKSTAHITYPLARKYDLAIIPEGSIHHDSLKLLIHLFNQAAPKQPEGTAKR
ncbi:MAG: hypothetical protein L6R40_007143 [Gallowayella cf. fulva]|nr:MAG: hypothetical protein L6R40_007143 [Xanthomendoza cf. fulva]